MEGSSPSPFTTPPGNLFRGWRMRSVGDQAKVSHEVARIESALRRRAIERISVK
jgi:hypothetical protein